MKDQPFDARRAVSCLGHRSRFSLVERLVRGERCVTDLAHDVALSQSCTTRHLQALERAGLVARTRQGKRVMYGLRRDPVELSGLLGLALGLDDGHRANGRARPTGSRKGSPATSRPRAPDIQPVAVPAHPSPATADEPSAPPGTEPAAEPIAAAPVNNDLEDWLL